MAGSPSGEIRSRLKSRLAESLQGEDWSSASTLLAALLDTWPLSAAAPRAVQTWATAADAGALAVLARVGEVTALAMDWPTLAGTPWPRPDASWLREAAQGADAVLKRHPDDDTERVAVALGVSVQEGSFIELPTVRRVSGAELVALREELGRALARGEIAAVELSTPLPQTAAAALALGEVRLEGSHQQNVERVGLAGTLTAALPAWRDVLASAPPGAPGEPLRVCCETAFLPGTPARLAEGATDTVGWLLWSESFRPVAVQPAAVAVVRAAEGRTVAELAAGFQVPESAMTQMVATLVSAGALTGPASAPDGPSTQRGEA